MRRCSSLTQIILSVVIAFSFCSSFAVAQYSATVPKTAADVIKPGGNTLMTKEYAQALATQAYLWGWPMVNLINRRTVLTNVQSPSHLNGMLPVAPMGQLSMLSDYVTPAQRAVACPNQDVVYGLGYMSLDKDPVIVQVPDFGDRFWVYAMYDGRTDQFSNIGKPYETKPGFYLVAGPNWKGKVPKEVAGVVHATMDLGVIIPRIFQDDTVEDRKAIQPLINQVAMYPLSQFNGKMKTIEWTKAPFVKGPEQKGAETKWVVPEKFFDQLAEVLNIMPPLPGEEAMYSNFRALLDTANRDPEIKKLIISTAIAADRDVVSKFIQWKYNGIPSSNGWNRSFNNAAWGFDYLNRLSTARSNIFENKVNETQYFYTDLDANKNTLNGNNTYEIHFAAGEEPTVNGFWSMTLYNKEHFFHANDLKRYSLGTKNKNLVRNSDGSLTLYAGARSPGKDKEANWLPAPKENFSLYIRAYWAKQPVLDGTWKPPVIRKIGKQTNLAASE